VTHLPKRPTHLHRMPPLLAEATRVPKRSVAGMATVALTAAVLTVAGTVVAALPWRPAGAQTREIGVYSGRHYNSDQALYRQFTARTGIRVKLLEGKDDALIERLRQEGANSPADVLVLVDAARLEKAARMGLFQPIRSASLQRDVPSSLRDGQGRWFALTRRVRVVVVNPKQVEPASIRTYADLAKPSLKGKLCLRDSRSVYNQSLVADQLIQRGETATRAWIRGMMANRNPRQPFFTADIPLARAVAKGDCAVGVVNSYYVARMLAGESGASDKTLARDLTVIFPNPAHVNVTGAGVTRASKKAEDGAKLIAFLASASGGKGYAAANNEYPLKGFGGNAILNRWGRFKDDGVSIQAMGARNREAVALMQTNGWR
jgi:iron(III) transport system substrate-binding protein